MKRTLLVTLLALLFLTVSAQKKSAAEKSDEYIANIIKAVKTTNFTFSALTMKPSLGKMVPVDVPEKTIDIVPGHITVEIPYDDAPTSAYQIPEYLLVNQPDFESEYTENDKTIILKVTVSGMPRNRFNPNSKLVFEFRVKKSNGTATVEVTPDMTHPITYHGSILPK